MNFGNVTGQKQIVESLQDAIINDKVGHAYVFTGSEGIGKRTIAKVFSALLLCDSQIGANSCDDCVSCKLFKEGSNPDFITIKPTGNTIGVDEIRNIQADIIIKPVYSKRKVYLIIDADKMTLQAQNCLLKTLEDPPYYGIIILTVTNYYALIETIRSRLLRNSFNRNTDVEVRDLIKSKFNIKPSEIDFIIASSNGIIGTALKLAESDEFRKLRDNTIELLFKLEKVNLSEIFSFYEFFEKNKSDIDDILEIMVTIYRDILVLDETGNQNMLINCDKIDIINSNAKMFTIRKLLRNISLLVTTRLNLKYNANFQLSMEVMLVKLQEEAA